MSAQQTLPIPANRKHNYGQSDIAEPQPKRRKQYTQEDRKLAKILNDLADEQAETRTKATKRLLEHYDDFLKPTSDSATQTLTVFNTPRNIYERLVAGLCSSRKAARPGFSNALTELLHVTLALRRLQNPASLEKLVAAYLALVGRATHPGAGVSSQVKRDYLLGQMFALNAIIRSKSLFQTETAEGYLQVVVNAVCKLSREAHWLRSMCGRILYEAVLDIAWGRTHHSYGLAIISPLCSNGLSRTPAGIVIWLEVRARFPSAQLLALIWADDDPLSKKELRPLSQIMREGQAQEPEKAISFVWPVIFLHLLSKASKPSPWRADFRQFWLEVVDNGYFAEKASPERKALGFHVLSKLMKFRSAGSAAVLNVALSANLMKCLINQSAHADRHLHDMAAHVLSELVDRAKSDADAAPVIIASLVSGNGSIHFDTLTKTNTVSSIWKCASDTALEPLVKLYSELIERLSTEDSKQVIATCQAVADQLTSLVEDRVKDLVIDANFTQARWLKAVLLTFVTHGYVSHAPSNGGGIAPATPVSAVARDIFRARLASCLKHIVVSRCDPEMVVSSFVVDTIHESRHQGKYDGQLSESQRRAGDTGMSMLRMLSNDASPGDTKNESVARAYRLLVSMALLRLYNAEAGTVSLLKDLESAYKAMSGKLDGDQHGSEMPLEIVLDFASKTSALYGEVAKQVFEVVASHISPEAIVAMLDILEADENLTGQQALFANEEHHDGSGSEQHEVEGDEESGSEMEVSDSASQKKDLMDISRSSESEDEEDIDNGKAGADELAWLDDALASALKTKKLGNMASPDGAPMGGDPGSSSDSDMDDDQMMALDPHLTAIFSQNKFATGKGSKKQEKKEAKENIIGFKTRVLTLLDIFVKENRLKVLVTELLLSLLCLIRVTTRPALAKKATSVLERYIKSAKKTASQGYQNTGLITVLETVHQEVLKCASTAHVKLCSSVSLLLARSMRGFGYSEIVELYQQTRNSCPVSELSRFDEYFFKPWEQWQLRPQD